MRMLKKITAIILVISMVLTLQGGVFIQLTNNVVKAQITEVDLPFYVIKDEDTKTKHVKRLKEDENEYMAIFENEDETTTVYSYSSPIQYKDANGKLIDYDPRLKEVKNSEKKSKGYLYEITSSDVSVMLPEDIATDKYITIEKDKYKIDFKPITESANTDKVKDKDEVKTEYKAKEKKTDEKALVGAEYLSPDSDDIKYQYYTKDTGIKEEIILESAPETSIFKFELQVKNIVPEIQEGGNVLFLDSDTKERVGAMTPFFMYDSYLGNGDDENDFDGPHMSYDIDVDIEQDKNNKHKYIMTVHFDDEFLNSEDTVYPVTVDPTITFDTAVEYLDSYVLSGSPNSNYGGSSGGYIGKTSSGIRRTYVCFVYPATYDPFDVVSATYRTYESLGYTSTAYAQIYPVTSPWSANSITWNNKASYDSTQLIQSKLINKKQWYTFTITSLVRDWVMYDISNGQDGVQNRGFMIKEQAEYNRLRCFSSSNSKYYRSVSVITYKQDNSSPNAVIISNDDIVVESDTANLGKAKISFSWDPVTDNPVVEPQGISYYEVKLFKEGGAQVGSTQTILHDDAIVKYNYTFDNLDDNQKYYATFVAYDDMSESVWIDDHPSDTTTTADIDVPDYEDIPFTLTPTDWTNDLTPSITWQGIPDTYTVQYSIDGGTTWVDTTLLGSAGAGELPNLGIVVDGEYQIKIRGIDSSTNDTTLESWELPYKVDVNGPEVNIASPQSSSIIGESVEITGSILDACSGVESWILEHGEGASPAVWETISSGITEKQLGEVLATWDTSSLDVGDYTIKLTALDNLGISSAEFRVTMNKPVAIVLVTPTNLAAHADNNYVVRVDWDDAINPDGTVYDVYRGSTADFTIDAATNLVADNVEVTYWNDFDAPASADNYYKVVAEYQVSETEKKISLETSSSNNALVSIPSEVGEKLGIQDFWKYSAFSAGNGSGYINVANGNLVYTATDTVFPGYMLAMTMRRTYNSQSDSKSDLGYGWDYSYNTCLYKENIRIENVNGSDIEVYDLILKDGDGSLHSFVFESISGNVWNYTTPTGIFMELEYDSALDKYTIQRKDYVTYEFRSDLKINKLSELNGNHLKFNYNDNGQLYSVENCKSDGTSVHQAYFFYYQGTDNTAALYKDPANPNESEHIGLLAMVMDPAGRTYTYTYIAGDAYLESCEVNIDATDVYKETYTYLNGYNLASVEDANGNITSVTYHTGAKVNRVTYPDNKYFELSYDIATNTTTVLDSWNHDTTYVYDANGCVTSVENTLDDITTFDYNDYYQVKYVSYQNYINDDYVNAVPITTTINYDDGETGEGTTGNVLTVLDPEGYITEFTYDTSYIYKVKTVTRKKDATTSLKTLENLYYTNGNLKKTIDAIGNETKYTYTPEGLIETVINYVGSEIDGENPSNTKYDVGTKTFYDYNDDGWLIEVRQGSKKLANSALTVMSKVISYDAKGNPTVTEDAMGNQTKVVYDNLGRPTETYLPDKDEKTAVWSDNLSTSVDYDLKGRVDSTTDIKGNVTSFAYDNMDRLTSTTQHLASGNIVSTVSYETYPKSTGNTCLMVVYTDPVGYDSATVGDRTITEYYDELGRVIRTTMSNGTSSLDITTGMTTYDKAGNVIKAKSMISNNDTSYTETFFEYDKLGRQTKTKVVNDAGQDVAAVTAYDYLGNVESETNAIGSTTNYQYDNIGRLKQVHQSEGATNMYTNYYYDIIKSYNSVNYVMNYVKDAENHVKETYLDEFGYPVVEINQGNIIDSNMMVVKRTYNNDGTVANVTQADGQIDTFTYNYWGQLENIQYGSGTNDYTTYTYNSHGQMSSLLDMKTDTVFGGTTSAYTVWTYDTIGRIQSVDQDGVIINYKFNNSGQITELKQPSDVSGVDNITSYTYDDYGRLESIYHKDQSFTLPQKIRDYEYLPTGQLNKTIDYLEFDTGNNGVLATKKMSTTYEYTKLGQVDKISYKNEDAQSIIEEYTYQYYRDGNIKQETVMNTHDSGTNLTKNYTYDNLGGLTKPTIGTDVTDYEYDKIGNRVLEESRQTNDYYDKHSYYTEFGQLDHVDMDINNGHQKVEDYRYDDRGALEWTNKGPYNSRYTAYRVSHYVVVPGEFDPITGEPIYEPVYESYIAYEYPNGAPRYQTTYTFDKAGYLQKTVDEVENNVYETTGHFYNGMEQRVRRVVKAIDANDTDDVTQYIYSGSTILFTTNGDDDKITENIVTPSGKTVASQRFDANYGGQFFFFNTDIRSSVTSIINDAYTPKKYYEYDSYGKAEEKGATDFINENTFTGAIAEGDGIYYMNARFYDANTGRFLSQDTYKGNAYEPWSQNLYSYCGNNPVNYVDPTGHFVVSAGVMLALYALGTYALTVATAPDFQYDMHELMTDVGEGNYGWAAFDVAMMLIPALPATVGKGTAKGIAKGAGEAIDFVGDLFKKSDDVIKNADLIFKKTGKTVSDLAVTATKNSDSAAVLLGKYKRTGRSYDKVAKSIDATYFNLDNWDEVSDLVGSGNMWDINKTFLDQQWSAGKDFYFSHNPWEATDSFEKEVLYLIDLGVEDFIQVGENLWKAVKSGG